MSILFGPVMPDTWDSVNNLFIGPPAPSISPSGFFPTPQQLQPIRSEITQPAVSMGVPRLTASDAPSLAESAAWAYNDWFNSPYEAQYAPGAQSVEPSFLDRLAAPFERTFTGLATATEEAFWEASEQLPGLLLRKVGLLPETQVVNTRGDTEVHLYQTPSMSRATVPGLIQEQPRGLFNMGYDDQVPARVVRIPPPATAALAVSPILMIVGLYLLFSR